MLPVLLDPAKFKDALVTAKGEERAHVALRTLETLWFNTGTLCNLTCQNCYIESSPRNDRLAYLSAAEVTGYLDEIERDGHGTQADRLHRRRAVHESRPAGHAGGRAVARAEGDGADQRHEADAQDEARRCSACWHDMATTSRIRVSLDHYERTLHEKERGARSWKPTIDGLVWLAQSGFDVHVAGRRFSEETEAEVRAGYARLFAGLGIAIDAAEPGVAGAVSRDGFRASTFRRSRRPAGASSRSRPTA